MDRQPLKIAFAVLLALGVLSLLPTQDRQLDPLPPPAPPSAPTSNEPQPLNSLYSSHAGLNACRKETGAFAGTIASAYYFADAWHYALDLGEGPTAPTGVRINPDGSRTYDVETYRAWKRSLVAANLFNVTEGKCPDGRP